MDIEEVIKWLKIMKANLNTFPEINCGKKIEALAEAIRLLKNEQSKEPTGSTTKNDLGVREFEEIVVEYPPEDLCTYPEYKGKPYLSIKYKEGNDCSVGYGTYNPKVFSRYLRDYFMPLVTPIRPKGHWIDHSDEGYVECPKCGSATNCDDNITDLHFCFSCGAEMESEVEE